MRPSSPRRALRLPLTIGNNAELAALVEWLRKLCASAEAREAFIRGEIVIEARLDATLVRTRCAAPAVAASAFAAPLAGDAPGLSGDEPATFCDEAVITEALLRRLARPGQALAVLASVVLTPSARDHARKEGIRLIGSRGQRK